MHWLSHDVEHLIEACKGESLVYAPDVLVVGSGYGGSVAALRFAEHGLDVAVLERGSEYIAGEFPTDLGQIGAFVRSEWGNKRETVATGYEDALFDFRVGTRASALVGNGLGGGSLINAAVALRPDARVFAQEAWPNPLRTENLDKDYGRAYEGLEIQSPQSQKDSPACVPQATLKYQRLHEIGEAAKRRFSSARLAVSTEDVPLAIEFRADTPTGLGPREACLGCGDCCSGCNHDAKLSLNKTYLPRARMAGARLYTGVSVLHVAHHPDAKHPGRDWVVHCVRTSERGTWAQACKAPHTGVDAAYVFTVRVGRVVLSAGTFGSTEILLRSRAKGLAVADAWLGKGISANGDDLSAAFDLKREANAVGEGSGPELSDKVGPTISGVIRFHDRDDHTRSTITEDGGVPGMLVPLVGEMLSTLGVFPQLTRFGLRSQGGGDPLAVRPDAVARSLVMLGMGHDSAAGRAQLASVESRLSWAWDEDAKDPAPKLHRSRMASVEDVGAEFLPNPISGALPEKIASVLSGPKLEGGWITVHPLGGCRMAGSPHAGVVNHRGQVFLPNGEVYAGLMVMDGSVMPTSLGVNPLLTITALAERACRLALAELPCKSPLQVALPDHPESPKMLRAVPGAPRGAVLAEVLRGPLTATPGAQALPAWLRPAVAGGTVDAALFLEMDVQDWQQLWQDPSHTVQAVAGVSGSRKLTASRLVVDRKDAASIELTVTGGQVQLFRAVEEFWLRRVERFVRTGLTYAIHRWVPDHFHPVDRPPMMQMLRDGPKILWHASAARMFDYRLELNDGSQSYRLLGTKFIQPALTWSELGQWCSKWMRRGGWPALQRRSVWEQLTQLDVQLFAGATATPLAGGRLAMDIPEMVRRIAPQMKPGPDTVQALAAFASYPLMVLRYLFTSRVLDFRLPDYSPELPAVDPVTLPDDGQFELSHDKYPTLRVSTGALVRPEPPVCLSVPLHAGTTPEAGSSDWIRIGLVRYAQPQVGTVDSPQGMRRFKSIILFNGFAQNTLPFVAEELGERSLAAMLYAQGWDVWLLEYRVSPFLRASARFSSMDDIGACDIPAAVNHVLAALQAQRSEPDLLPGQVFVFSHCVGSASMAMSLLGGHLVHPGGQPKVAGVLFSQFQPYVIGSVTAQMRLQVASVLVNAMGLEFIEFAAGTTQADGLHAIMDRFFASLDYDPHERCPGEHDLRDARPDSTSCKRMSGFLSRLFRHDQLIESTPDQRGTHEKLDEYFGRTNLGVFLHGAKCVEYERLVDADGQNIYVTDPNVRKYLTMPVMLLHGEDNVLFDKESLQETQRQFSRAFGPQRLQSKHDRFLLAPGHAHFDCTIGKRAPEVIFSEVVAFFDNALQADLPAQGLPNRLRARLARTGPLVGWTRRVGDNNVFRVWIEVDNTQADAAVAAMTLVSAGRYRCIQAWNISSNPVHGLLAVSDPSAPDHGISYAVADVEVPADWGGVISIAMVSLHRFTADAPFNGTGFAHGWPQSWGQPMTAAEATQSAGRSPALTVPEDGMAGAAHGGVAMDSVDTYTGTEEEVITRPQPYQPDVRIQPMPMHLNLRDARALLLPLARLVRAQRALARQANPGTLSRQRRTLRWIGECVLRLRGDMVHADMPGNASPATPLRFFASTCRHPGISELETLRSDHTLEALAKRQHEKPASFMWMLGDQIYADARAGLVDSASSIERLLPRYREAFGSQGFAALARNLPLYMVMDDHEIGDNWSKDELALGESQNVLYQNALSAFGAFQRAHGPAGLGPQGHDASFSMGGAAFLSLNTRVHRHRASGPLGPRSILHPQQWDLLERWLESEQRKGKHPKFLVTGSVFAPGLLRADGALSPRDIDNWQLAENERKRLLSFIAERRIDNVVFLSGDYHCSARATIRFSQSGVLAYCLVTPPLHAPLRFANVAAAEVMPHEVLALNQGTAEIATQAWNGEGWLECELHCAAGGAFALHTLFRAQRMDIQEPDHMNEIWHLT
ncbi:MAG: alkaline phosphatase D family protein [Rhodoferax sp.]|nr:alkaline phosphatase D family protein [Rhodoferax sp.]MDP3653655.1 alkaline phosphatase D family protein [Rhodoferax sp.]